MGSFSAVQGDLLLLRGARLSPGQEQDPVSGAERQGQPLGQPQVQLRQPRSGPHVPLCPVVKGRLGLNHVPRIGRSWTRSTGNKWSSFALV